MGVVIVPVVGNEEFSKQAVHRPILSEMNLANQEMSSLRKLNEWSLLTAVRPDRTWGAWDWMSDAVARVVTAGTGVVVTGASGAISGAIAGG